MSNLILHFDGSRCKVDNKRTELHWGIIALTGDVAHETMGGDVYPISVDFCHELAAFVAAVKLAVEMGFTPFNTAMYTDDQRLRYAHEGARLHSHGPATATLTVQQTISHVCRTIYPQDVTLPAHCADFLFNVRMHKVNGKDRGIYHARADYLARANRLHKDSVQPFDEWLDSGFVTYDTEGTSKRYVPFTGEYVVVT